MLTFGESLGEAKNNRDEGIWEVEDETILKYLANRKSESTPR